MTNNFNMSRYDAYSSMLSGRKVQHKSFNKDEYIFMDDDELIKVENGASFDDMFSICPSYEDGWRTIGVCD